MKPHLGSFGGGGARIITSDIDLSSSVKPCCFFWGFFRFLSWYIGF